MADPLTGVAAAAAETSPPPAQPSTEPPEPNPSKATIQRTFLRYTLSPSEYATIYNTLAARSRRRDGRGAALAKAVTRRIPSVEGFERSFGAARPVKRKEGADEGAAASGDGGANGDGDETAAAVRASLRIFAGTWAALGVWEGVKKKVFQRGKTIAQPPRSTLLSPNIRLSLSLSTIFLLHRLLYRFLSVFRGTLLSSEARPFRIRNPRISRVLVSRLAPAVGASLAGSLLAVYPADQLRMTMAIYAITKAVEFAWNRADRAGLVGWRPWWFGSWMLFPVSCGQLLHAFIFDRDCFPTNFGDFILKYSGNYIQKRPEDYPASLPWPDTHEIVDNLATVAKMNYPPFISPILFPNSNKGLPSAITAIAPVVDPAHPAIKHLTCAMLHPADPSCVRAYLTFYIQAFPRLARFVTILFAVLSLPRYRSFLAKPLPSIEALSKSIVRTSLFFAGAIGTSWGSICLLQHLLPRTFLPTQRFFLGGAMGGLWAFLERKGGRGKFTYGARLSVDSAWKVATKHGWVKGVKYGDVWVFVAGLALLNAVYEVDPAAVDSGPLRKVLGFARGKGYVDVVAKEKEKDLENEEETEDAKTR
ncbi:MAG: hypothetical protein M4579_005429 [Chaenotheca gracillima]|nr:MAG: hypothetical protein M4579_005429 [Chaenotheca gracillima]